MDSPVPEGLTTKTFASSARDGRLHGYDWRNQFWIVPDTDTEGRRLWTVCNAETGRVLTWNYSLPYALVAAGWLITPRIAGRDS